MDRLHIDVPNIGEVSDGYHTFNELYAHRITLFIVLCRVYEDLFETVDGEWGGDDGTFEPYEGQVRPSAKMRPWRSKLHSDGTGFEGWFIMGMGKEAGKQITYHLPMSKWDETGFAETLDRAPVWDGHTSEDVLERLNTL